MSEFGCSNDRRRFIKSLLFVGASSLMLPVLVRKQAILSAIAEEKLSPVDPKDPTAQALGYIDDATKTDTKKFPKRAGADGKKQFCDNCMFFAAIDKKRGKCQIFPARSVAAKGWCNSWVAKP